VVEGQARTRHRNDAICDRRRILQYIHRWNPNCVDPVRPQPAIPTLIARRPVAHVMRNPVNLDHHPRVGAIKIHADPAARVLPPKLHALGLATQQAPQQHFGQAHFLPKLPRTRDRAWSRLRCAILEHQPAPPPPPAAAVPLPETSSGRIQSKPAIFAALLTFISIITS
jgi:hypothetical protein